MKTQRFVQLVLIVILTGSAWAGTTGKIAGVVRTDGGEPVPGADIVIAHQIIDGEEVALSSPTGAAADADGYFFVINLKPGSYVVTCSFLGYQTTVKKPVKVAVDRTTQVDFSLEEMTVEGEAVIVIDERELVVKDLTSASAKVSGEVLSNLPVESFGEVIALQAGTQVDQFGGLHIRGGRSSEIQYYVDGVPVSNPYSNSLAVDVANNAIQEVEVISGTFNAEYGQAQSGIVNIVTREGSTELNGTFSAYSGDFFSDNTDIFWNIDDVSMASQQYYEGSLSGPLFSQKLRFFVSGRMTDHENWLYGQRVYLPIDSASFASPNSEEWYIESTGDGAYVPMNPAKNMSGMFKLNFDPVNSLGLAYSLMANDGEGRVYSPSFRLNPDSRRTNYTTSYNHLFTLTHTPSNSIFYTLKLTQYNTDFETYVHEDPNHPDYMAIFGRDRQPSNVFSTGSIDPLHRFQDSQTLGLRGDFNMQLNKSNLVKMGVEYRRHKLDLQEYFIDVDPFLYGDLESVIPPTTSADHNQYSQEPIEISAYIQDKIEIDDFIVNAGIRFDYFDPQASVPADLRDPGNSLFPVAEPEAYTDVDPKTQISPRLGLAFPISSRGVFHAAYGSFFQIPEFSRLYENPDFETVGFYSSFIGNADLEAQRTDMYEIGLQQELTSFLAVDVTGYYRNVKNLLGTELFQTYRTDILYGRYANNSHGSVRGLTLAAKIRLAEQGLTADLNYTYQSAKGIASDPKQAFWDAAGRNESVIVLNPLDWDLRHNFNAYLVYMRNAWTGSVIVNMNSGYPFTPAGYVELRNAGRLAGDLNVDLSVQRGITLLDGFDIDVFMKVINVFDRTRPDLLPEVRPQDVEAHNSNGFDLINSLYDFTLNPSRQPIPREIRVGTRFNF